jgi:indolepyruvate ferredoxin oxidoreductase, beta subunit
MNPVLFKEPINLIITGVGGQGNVLASQVLGRMLIRRGLRVTIGETYGLSQRGGAVMSQVRISTRKTYGPLIPGGQADLVVGMEPLEVLRTLGHYGRPDIRVLTNDRPIYPINVLSGSSKYPETDRIHQTLEELARKVWWLPITREALQLGNAILANMVMVGALIGTGLLPIEVEDFTPLARDLWDPGRAALNIRAIEKGVHLVQSA